jgi:hypothetical protein
LIKARAIIPKGLIFDIPKQKAAITKGLDATAKRVEEAYDKITGSWKSQPSITVTATEFERAINVDGAVYGYVDDGTKAHTIAPHGKMLSFSPGGSAKTQPGVIGSGGGSRGSTKVFARVVHHPGSAPRNFEDAILSQVVDPYFASDMQSALDEAVD